MYNKNIANIAIVEKDTNKKYKESEKIYTMQKKTWTKSLLGFILAGVLAIIATVLLSSNPDVSISETGRIWELKSPVVKEEVKVPTEEDLRKLEESYNRTVAYLEEKEVILDKITELYSQVQKAKVCSKANKYFNSLEEEYNAYKEQLDEIQKYISEFEEEYNAYASMLEEIPNYAKALKEDRYSEFEERLKPEYDFILSEKQKYQAQEETIANIYISAKKIADDFFEEYYELMCQLVVGEADGEDLMEQARVMNVAENRVEHEEFKYYTIYDVIFAPGQYECTWNGQMNKPQSEQLRENVRAYLRGEVETGMPADVVYQAKFPQGSRKDEPWFYNEKNGHYYCYY